MDALLTSPWPFAVRDSELDLLRTVLLDRTADVTAVVVVANAGVGKTRLLSEFTRVARATGAATVTVVGSVASSGAPYGALSPLAAQLGLDPGDPAALHHGIVQHLSGVDGQPRVLLVDDAHWLDAGTAALVLHLATARAVGVAVTIRNGLQPPAAITTLWRDEQAIRLDLGPFTQDQHSALLHKALGAPIDARSLRKLAQVSGGNALYLRDLVRGAVASGALRTHHGVWTWDGHVVLTPPLTDMIGARLNKLGAGDAEALALLALGEPLRLAVAVDAVGPDCLARLEDAGFIRVTSPSEGEQVQLDHPLYGEVLLQRTPRVTQQRLLSRLAGRFARLPDAGRHRLRVTGWRLAAGETVPTDDLLEAAQAAGAAYDFELAERLARAALPRSGTLGRIALAGALSGLGRFHEAEAMLAEAEREVISSGDDELLYQYVHERYLNLHRGLGVPAPLVPLLDDLVANQSDRPVGQLARGLRANVHLETGDLASASELTAPVLDDPSAAPQPLVLCVENAAEVMAYRGDTTTARVLHGRLHRLARDHPEVGAQASATALLQGAMCDLFDGQVTAAVAVLQAGYDQMIDHPDPVIRGLGAMMLGAALLHQGRVPEAVARLRNAVALRSTGQVGDGAAWALALLCQGQVMVGDLEAARATLSDAERHRTSQPVARCQQDLVRAHVLVEMATGRQSQAIRRCLDGAADLADFTVYHSSLLHLAVRIGADPRPCADQLATAAAEVAAPMPGVQARHARAVLHQDALGLEAVAEEFESGGLWLEAAEALSRASVLHERSGRQGGATRTAATAGRLLDRCGLSGSPLMSVTPMLPHLSRREREIVTLAAQGLSNATIAAELVVSVRTVESHLYNAYAKLGVTRRDELATLFRIPTPH